MKPALLILPIALAGCGGAFSDVKDAEVRCAKCQADMAVAVGVPLKLEVDWKKCSSLDQGCDTERPPFAVAITCDGAACDVEDTSGGDYLVTPTAPGTMTIVVTLKDRGTRVERIGPVTAMPLDGLAMTCTVIPAGGGRDQAVPCPDRIPAGAEVALEIGASSGATWLASPVPRDVAIDGRVIYAAGQMTRDGEWTCRASSEASDPKVPTVTRCRAIARPGARWQIEARLPDQRLAGRLTVTVDKP
jgi:hypothetical protein